jgi:hypothetical protein
MSQVARSISLPLDWISMTISEPHEPSLAIPIPVHPELWVILLKPVDRPHPSPLSKASLGKLSRPNEREGCSSGPEKMRHLAQLEGRIWSKSGIRRWKRERKVKSKVPSVCEIDLLDLSLWYRYGADAFVSHRTRP